MPYCGRILRDYNEKNVCEFCDQYNCFTQLKLWKMVVFQLHPIANISIFWQFKKEVEFFKIVPFTNVPISCTLCPIILATKLIGIVSLWSLEIFPPYENIISYTIQSLNIYLEAPFHQFLDRYWVKSSWLNRNRNLWVFYNMIQLNGVSRTIFLSVMGLN